MDFIDFLNESWEEKIENTFRFRLDAYLRIGFLTEGTEKKFAAASRHSKRAEGRRGACLLKLKSSEEDFFLSVTFQEVSNRGLQIFQTMNQEMSLKSRKLRPMANSTL